MTAARKHLSAATKMAKIKSGAWYVDGDLVFQVLGVKCLDAGKNISSCQFIRYRVFRYSGENQSPLNYVR